MSFSIRREWIWFSVVRGLGGARRTAEEGWDVVGKADRAALLRAFALRLFLPRLFPLRPLLGLHPVRTHGFGAEGRFGRTAVGLAWLSLALLALTRT